MRSNAILALAVLGLASPLAAQQGALLVGYAPDCRAQPSAFLYECAGWGIAAVDEATGARLPDVVAPQSGEYELTYFTLDDRCDIQAGDQLFQGETGDYVGLFRPYGKDHVDAAWFTFPIASRPSEILLDDFSYVHVFDQRSGDLLQTVDKTHLGFSAGAIVGGMQLLDDRIYLFANVGSAGVSTGFQVKRLDGATRELDSLFNLQRTVFVDSQTYALLPLQLGANSAGELVAWETVSGPGGYTYQLERFDIRTGLYLGTVSTGIAPTPASAGVSFFDGLFYSGWTPTPGSSATPQIHRYSADTGREVLPPWSLQGASFVTQPLARRTCTPDNRVLRLNQGRFEVAASFRTPAGDSGDARAAGPRTAQSGQLWFFSKSNPELTVKVLDGCASNGSYWVFLAGLTNLAVEVTVTDTTTGNRRTYGNAQGQMFAPIEDTAAFAVCP